MHHDLKIIPCYFQAVVDGDKRFEIRDTRDRGFQRGDTILLREYKPGAMQGFFTGREFHAQITYVTTYQQKPEFVVFSFRESNLKDHGPPQ